MRKKQDAVLKQSHIKQAEEKIASVSTKIPGTIENAKKSVDVRQNFCQSPSQLTTPDPTGAQILSLATLPSSIKPDAKMEEGP